METETVPLTEDQILDIALTIRCPKCSARGGDPCAAPDGSYARKIHTARIAAARKVL